MQLVAYGAQDIYLTGNPQITFFKVVYRRHTNFSMEAIEQTFNGSVGFGKRVTATISRNGDLVHRMYLEMSDSSATAATCANLGTALVNSVELEIGGQKIDKHYGQWLDIWNELTDHDEQEWIGLNKHMAKDAYLNSDGLLGKSRAQRLYVPLQFWFCRNPGLALPLIALQYHEVKVKLTTRAMGALVVGDYAAAATAAAPTSVQLWADYIYLDTDERRRFAQVSHEYLIEQLQKEEGTDKTTMKLNFNHPVKELIWVNQDADVLGEVANNAAGSDVSLNVGGLAMGQGNDFFNYEGAADKTEERIAGVASNESFGDMKLQLNGHDRFAARNASYFRTCQPLQAGHKVPSKHIYCYSFALKPEEHQPSGTCNFSRIDNAKMVFTHIGLTTGTSTLTVYAVNYNVLRIMSGMGGLAYSN
jgi:hypothetical protein